jgi:hypothetical protein
MPGTLASIIPPVRTIEKTVPQMMECETNGEVKISTAPHSEAQND